MQLRTIVTVLGEVYGWWPGNREFISTINADGTAYAVRSRNESKCWEAFINGISIKLFRKLCEIKDSGGDFQEIQAKIFYRGESAPSILSLRRCEEGFSVCFRTKVTEEDRGYGNIDRAMHGFFLKLCDIMKERMTVLTVTRKGGG